MRLDGSDGYSQSRTAVVVGHDHHAESLAALAAAINIAGRLSAHLHVVHAVTIGDYPIDPDAADWEESARNKLAKDRATVTEHLREHLREHKSGWTYLVGRGDPARLLISVADEHNAVMIVVGSRGEGLRLLLGRLIESPVSHRLIQHAQRPVLVVGPPTSLPDST